MLAPALAVAVVLAGTAGAEEPLTLERAIETALSANRQLAAARLGLEVTRADAVVASQRRNPEFGIEASRDTPHEAYTLAYPFELGGKRGRRIEVSEAAGASGEAEIARLTLETRVAVRRAYYSVAAAQARLDELSGLLSLAERTRDAAKDRFESGAAARLEMVQADLAVSGADNDVGAARAALAAARAELNVLLALPPDRPIAVAADLGAGTVPAAAAAVDLALTSSLDLALADRRLQEAEARLELARAERVPDLVLLGGVTRDSPPEFDTGWKAGAAIELPIFNRGRGEILREESSLSQLRAEREAIAERIRASVHGARLLAAAQQERYLRFREQILPQADEVEGMASDSYRSGQTGLVAMLQAFASVRDTRLKAVEAGLEYQMALADLERAVGGPLP